MKKSKFFFWVMLLSFVFSMRVRAEPYRSVAALAAVGAGSQTSIEMPCGRGFLGNCSELIHQIIQNKDAEAQSHLKRFVSFLYNYGTKPKPVLGKDTKGKEVIKKFEEIPLTFPGEEGIIVDISSSKDPVKTTETTYGVTCSRCPTFFNDEMRETVVDYKGRSCGSPTTVRVTLSGIFANIGTNAYAWYRGFYTYILSEVMKTTFEEVVNSARQNNGIPKIPVSPGCQKFAESIIDLMNNKDHGIKFLESTLDKIGILEIAKHDATWQEFFSAHPDKGELRQLAQELKTMRDALEKAAGNLLLCTIYDRAGIAFRARVGSWEEFFNPQVVSDINSRVRSKVLSACSGACKLKGIKKHIGRCLRCLNHHANLFTPPEIGRVFDKKCDELEAL